MPPDAFNHRANYLMRVKQTLHDPLRADNGHEQRAPDPKQRIRMSAAHQKQRRQNGDDDAQLHRLDAEIEAQDGNEPIPLPGRKITQGRGKCQPVNEPENGCDDGLAARKKRADGMYGRHEDGDRYQNLDRSAWQTRQPVGRQRQGQRMTDGESRHDAQNLHQAAGNRGASAPTPIAHQQRGRQQQRQ